MTEEQSHIVIAKAMGIIDELLEVGCKRTTMALAHLSLRIRHCAPTIERLISGGIAILIITHRAIESQLQSLDKCRSDVGKTSQREGISH